LFTQRLMRKQDELATAETWVVCVSAVTFRPVRLPVAALFGGDQEENGAPARVK